MVVFPEPKNPARRMVGIFFFLVVDDSGSSVGVGVIRRLVACSDVDVVNVRDVGDG